MLIAHGPAGYLLTRFLSRTLFKDIVVPERKNRLYQRLMVAGVLGGIFPDFDFIYHLFIDSARTSHHSYLTHIPMFWLALLLIFAGYGGLRKNIPFMALSSTFCLGAILHLVLDTLTGVVYWFYPLSSKGLNIFKVADIHVWWVHNYTYHWTFLIEIGIIAAAMIIFMRVKETIADIVHLFRKQEKLRALSLRIGICAIGVAVIAVVGAMKFTLDNRAVEKIIKIKQYVARMLGS
jgi:dipeptide/tripeptide permease